MTAPAQARQRAELARARAQGRLEGMREALAATEAQGYSPRSIVSLIAAALREGGEG